MRVDFQVHVFIIHCYIAFSFNNSNVWPITCQFFFSLILCTERVYRVAEINTAVYKCCSDFFVLSCLICHFILSIGILDSIDCRVTC